MIGKISDQIYERNRKEIKIKIIYLYLIFAFIILIPLHGYVFLLDFARKTNTSFISDFFYGKIDPIYGGSLPFNLILILVPPENFQKIIYFIILLSSGYAIYNLTDRLVPTARFFSGLLYMINPYIYINMLTGRWTILLSYAIIPLSIKYFIELLEKKERKSAIKFIFFTSLVAFNIHMLIIALIIMIIIFIFWLFKYRDIRNIKIIPIAMIIFLLLNFYWIFPLVTAKNTMIDNIGEEDYKVFAPKIDNLSDLFNIASMYGFWREGYIYAKDFIPYWQLLSSFIILLAIYGFISFYQDEKIGYIVKALGLIGIMGFVLATGINGPFGDLNHWLYDNTILKGFRDSHKFVAMIVLAYAVLGGLGVNKIKSMYDNRVAYNEIRCKKCEKILSEKDKICPSCGCGNKVYSVSIECKAVSNVSVGMETKRGPESLTYLRWIFSLLFTVILFLSSSITWCYKIILLIVVIPILLWLNFRSSKFQEALIKLKNKLEDWIKI